MHLDLVLEASDAALARLAARLGLSFRSPSGPASSLAISLCAHHSEDVNIVSCTEENDSNIELNTVKLLQFCAHLRQSLPGIWYFGAFVHLVVWRFRLRLQTKGQLNYITVVQQYHTMAWAKRQHVRSAPPMHSVSSSSSSSQAPVRQRHWRALHPSDACESLPCRSCASGAPMRATILIGIFLIDLLTTSVPVSTICHMTTAIPHGVNVTSQQYQTRVQQLDSNMVAHSKGAVLSTNRSTFGHCNRESHIRCKDTHFG